MKSHCHVAPVAAQDVNSSTVYSFPWQTTCPSWNVKICCNLVLASWEPWSCSVHTRQSKNTQLTTWKLFFLTLRRKHQVPFSFAVRKLGFWFSQQIIHITKSSCGDPIQLCPLPGGSGDGSCHQHHCRGCWWESLWHQVQESLPRRRQEEYQPPKKKTVYPPPLTHRIKLWTMQWDITAWNSLLYAQNATKGMLS